MSKKWKKRRRNKRLRSSKKRKKLPQKKQRMAKMQKKQILKATILFMQPKINSALMGLKAQRLR